MMDYSFNISYNHFSLFVCQFQVLLSDLELDQESILLQYVKIKIVFFFSLNWMLFYITYTFKTISFHVSLFELP